MGSLVGQKRKRNDKSKFALSTKIFFFSYFKSIKRLSSTNRKNS